MFKDNVAHHVKAFGERLGVAPPNFELLPEASVAKKLDMVRRMPTAEEQFCYLASSYPYDDNLFKKSTPQEEDIDALIDFASDPTASSSLIVRALAFDYAANAILSQEWADPTIKAELDEFVPPDLRANGTFIRRPTGEWYDEELGRWDHGWRESSFPAQFYRGVAIEVSKKDGLGHLLVTEWNDFGHTNDFAEVYDDNIPTTAFLLLDSLSKKMASYNRGSEPHSFSRFAKLIPLALEIQRLTYTPAEMNSFNIAPSDMQEMEADSKEIQELLGYKEQAQPYIEAFTELSAATKRLPEIFPEEYRDGVMAGATAMFNDALYAVRAHLEGNSKTAEKLPLSEGGRVLPLELHGSEPLALLQNITDSINELHNTLSDPEMGVTAVSEGADFQIYRLWKNDVPGSNVSVYIRPFGAGAYDGELEYGRGSEGVEASISYVVDTNLSPNKVSHIGKTKGSLPDNRISIRLDREGVIPEERGKAGSTRDPIREQGTLSLDIGSVIGDEGWLSTKVGRFLAWGNMLRANRLQQSSQLNHSTEYFSPEDGKAKTFARAALVLSHELGTKQLSKKEIAKRLAGIQAVSAAHNIK